MFRRVMSVLIALVVILAAAPSGARAMPVASTSGGMAMDQPCQNCPPADQTGDTTPDKMPPVCQALACAGVLAMLPERVWVSERVPFRVVYAPVPSARWVDAAPVPDPFPPRPIVLP
jgi:hypothetical protein